jgi:hypothetical protein
MPPEKVRPGRRPSEELAAAMNAEWFRFPDYWTEFLLDLDEEHAIELLIDRAFLGITITHRSEENTNDKPV